MLPALGEKEATQTCCVSQGRLADPAERDGASVEALKAAVAVRAMDGLRLGSEVARRTSGHHARTPKSEVDCRLWLSTHAIRSAGS